MSDTHQEPSQNPPVASGSPLPALSPETPGKPRRPVTVVILSVLAMLLLIAGIAALKARQISQAIAMGKAFKMPPDAVTTVKVSPETIQPSIPAVGSLSSPQGVMMSADLPGVVTAIPFESGSHVTNGQVLVRLDTRQEEAQLRSALAKLELARQNLERARDLGQKHVIAQSAFDDAKSQFDASTAIVDETRATIARKTILAPFEGETGIRQINVGQYLKSGDPIVQLDALDTVYVNYALPQQYLGMLHVGQPVMVKADGLPSREFAGTINAINSMVDTATRNIQVQATLPNPGHLLRSGMFAAVRTLLPDRKKSVMIPASSIQYAPYGDSVFVVATMKDKDGKDYLGVREQTVQLGETRGDQVEILKGLSEGDEVVTSGIFKLRQGGAVKIENAVQPGNNPAPKPIDS
jgi:membrane fusion protein, multidrug efflux system